MFETNSNFESKITFEIPTSIDLEKLAKLNPNFTLLSGLNTTNVIDINSSDFVLNGGDFNSAGYLNSGDDFNTNLFYSQYQHDYDRFISDIWVGIILTLMIGLSIFSICACYLHHKYQQWKLSAYNLRQSTDLENGFGGGNGENGGIQSIDIESLPSYTIVSGLPTYDDAIEEMRKNKSNYIQQQHGGVCDSTVKDETNRRPSIIKLFSNHYLKYNNKDDEEPQPSTPVNQHKVPSYNEYLYHTVPCYEEAVINDCSNNMLLLSEIMMQQSIKHKIPTYEETLSLMNTNRNSRRLSVIEVPVHNSNSSSSNNNCSNNNKFHISSCSNYSSISFSSLDELLNRNKHYDSSNSNSYNNDKLNFLKTKNLSINF